MAGFRGDISTEKAFKAVVLIRLIASADRRLSRDRKLGRSLSRVLARGNFAAGFRGDISTEKATNIVPILCLQILRSNSPVHP